MYAACKLSVFNLNVKLSLARNVLQVSLYFPEESHQAFGIIRAVLRDATDVDLGDISQVREPPTKIQVHLKSMSSPVCNNMGHEDV